LTAASLSSALQTTLETSGEDAKLHSKRVEKMPKYTRNEWKRCQNTLETSGKDVKIHSKRVDNIDFQCNQSGG
jgi:hypothetical protein